MASPNKKLLAKDVERQSLVRAAVTEAIKEKRNVSILMDGRPCSIEIGRSTKGVLIWNVKVYTMDAQETLDTVPIIKMIETSIQKHFVQCAE